MGIRVAPVDDFAGVLGRVQGGKLLLDVRTVFDEQIEPLVEAVRAAAVTS